MTSQASIRSYLNQAYLLGLMMLAVGLTLSPYLMGMSQFWLVIVWLLDACVSIRHYGLAPSLRAETRNLQNKEGGSSGGEGGLQSAMSSEGFKQKLLRFWHNKVAVLLVAFYLMHVVGLLYTTDFTYAMKDLRVKLPLLVLPFVMSSMEPLDRKRFDLLLNVYVLSVFVATLFSFTRYVRHDYEDIREISRFISHIRFCLHIVFCIAIIGYYIIRKVAGYRRSSEGPTPASRRNHILDTILMCILLLWFVYQIYIFESLSGYVILAGVILVSVIYVFLQGHPGRGWRIAVAAVVLALVTASAVVLWRAVRPLVEVETVDFSTLDQKTALGNDYWHDTIYNPVEDGKYVGLYYCRKELQEAWPLRSTMDFEGTALNGENLEATLARYLTSKGLRKDAQGVEALTDEDVYFIELGEANYNNRKHPGLRARLSVTLFEYNMYRRFNNPNGGSLSQRIEFTRASFHIIRQHPWFGVGTGDVPQAFSQAYDEIHSPLREEFRFRAHNQYLAIAVAFGLMGLAFFIVVLFYPYASSRRRRTYLYTVFLFIMLLSMFPEDTLETQAGATLFAFFESLLLLTDPQEC